MPLCLLFWFPFTLLLFLPPALLLLKKKKTGWYLSLFSYIIWGIFVVFFLEGVAVLIDVMIMGAFSFILLLLDRKNFWKIAI